MAEAQRKAILARYGIWAPASIVAGPLTTFIAYILAERR